MFGNDFDSAGLCVYKHKLPGATKARIDSGCEGVVFGDSSCEFHIRILRGIVFRVRTRARDQRRAPERIRDRVLSRDQQSSADLVQQSQRDFAFPVRSLPLQNFADFEILQSLLPEQNLHSCPSVFLFVGQRQLVLSGRNLAWQFPFQSPGCKAQSSKCWLPPTGDHDSVFSGLPECFP